MMIDDILPTMTADGAVALSLRSRLLIHHTPGAPFVNLGRGEARMDMYRGNFDIEDAIIAREPMTHVEIDGALLHFRAAPGAAVRLTLEVSGDDDRLVLSVRHADPTINRVWLRLPAEADEHVWGCGEQMSYFDLRGRRFPLWTSEPGVGRDKTTEITRQADEMGHAGGDYYTTNFPQPTFLSSRHYAAHVQTTAYSVFDFTDPASHELEIWAVPERLELFAADRFTGLVGLLSERFGRQPELPEWLYAGAVIGLKDGAASITRLETFLQADTRVSALWCEDWAGIRTTSFGTRLFWDWRWNAQRYPELDRRIAELRARGIRFMGYVSPYLCEDGTLFPEAEALGHLARKADGGTYLVDFGEFACGVVDFTSPDAATWFGDRIIRGNMLDLGMSGWMCDFGEYLPIDVHLANNVDARLMHNAWPEIWGRVNAEAVARAGMTGDILFFMRAGFTGVQRHCPMLWAGDQCVDFSRHDGLQTVICGALSAGLLGSAYHHSDVGGYTSLFGNVRTPELIQRWAEMAAFTAMMRTHEGNRPRDNLQIDQSPDVLAHFARMTRIWYHLTPYLRHLSAEAAATGLPVQRPLFLHHEDDPNTYTIQDSYLYGADLLVSPVHAQGVSEWSVYLPTGSRWRHVWSHMAYEGGQHIDVPAPIGAPPVFWREGSPFQTLFEALTRIA